MANKQLIGQGWEGHKVACYLQCPNCGILLDTAMVRICFFDTGVIRYCPNCGNDNGKENEE